MHRRWIIDRLLGSGAFGRVYKGRDLDYNQPLAFKMAKHNDAALKSEADAYKSIEDVSRPSGIPKCYKFFQYEGFDCLVLQLLSKKNVRDLFIDCGGRLSRKDILMLGFQMVSALRSLHISNTLHCDLKPANMVPGINDDRHDVYLVDYGLCSFVFDRTGQHVQRTGGWHIPGNIKYASLRSHYGTRWSRRDDMESLGFVLLDLTRRGLPWSSIRGTGPIDRFRVLRRKNSVGIAELCQDLPMMVRYMRYVRGLKFEEEPDYTYLRALFSEGLVRMGISFDDRAFDWERPARTQRRHSVQGGRR